eukprot:15474977-Alexandrium_andersonii.AAC.1
MSLGRDGGHAQKAASKSNSTKLGSAKGSVRGAQRAGDRQDRGASSRRPTVQRQRRNTRERTEQP